MIIFLLGFDFSFGKRGRGKVSDLLKLEPIIKVNVIEELKVNDKKVSSSFIIEEPLVVYKDNGDYSDEILKIYHKK